MKKTKNMHLIIITIALCISPMMIERTYAEFCKAPDDGHLHSDDEKQCDDEHVQKVPVTHEQVKRLGIKISRAVKGAVHSELRVPGEIKVNSDRVAHVVPRAAGIVREVKKELGDLIQAGEILAWIESDELVEAKLDFLKSMVNKYVDIVFANEEEAKSFTNLEPKEACAAIAKEVKISVVKVGKDGAYIQEGNNEMIHVPAFKANSIDTTGAGDSYAAGFLYGYTNGASHYNSSRIGALIAGNIIEYLGAKMPDETWNKIMPEIKEMLN